MNRDSTSFANAVNNNVPEAIVLRPQYRQEHSQITMVRIDETNLTNSIMAT